MALEIDHVVFCVESLEEASRSLEIEHGLASVPGGRHEGHGTANRIVPLGSAYLELVAVMDATLASSSAFGRWVGSKAAEDLSPHLLCLRTGDLDELSQRLQIDSLAMSRERPDGVILRWRLAGLERALGYGLPFFIEWDIDPSQHPGRSAFPQASDATSLSVILSGDGKLLTEWARGASGVAISQGEPAVHSVTIRGTWGEVEL